MAFGRRKSAADWDCDFGIVSTIVTITILKAIGWLAVDVLWYMRS